MDRRTDKGKDGRKQGMPNTMYPPFSSKRQGTRNTLCKSTNKHMLANTWIHIKNPILKESIDILVSMNKNVLSDVGKPVTC